MATEAEVDGDADGAALGEADAAAEALGAAVTDATGDADGAMVGATDGDDDGAADADGAALVEAAGEALAACAIPGMRYPAGTSTAAADADGLTLGEVDAEAAGLADAAGLTDTDATGDGVLVGVATGLGDGRHSEKPTGLPTPLRLQTPQRSGWRKRSGLPTRLRRLTRSRRPTESRTRSATRTEGSSRSATEPASRTRAVGRRGSVGRGVSAPPWPNASTYTRIAANTAMIAPTQILATGSSMYGTSSVCALPQRQRPSFAPAEVRLDADARKRPEAEESWSTPRRGQRSTTRARRRQADSAWRLGFGGRVLVADGVLGLGTLDRQGGVVGRGRLGFVRPARVRHAAACLPSFLYRNHARQVPGVQRAESRPQTGPQTRRGGLSTVSGNGRARAPHHELRMAGSSPATMPATERDRAGDGDDRADRNVLAAMDETAIESVEATEHEARTERDDAPHEALGRLFREQRLGRDDVDKVEHADRERRAPGRSARSASMPITTVPIPIAMKPTTINGPLRIRAPTTPTANPPTRLPMPITASIAGIVLRERDESSVERVAPVHDR